MHQNWCDSYEQWCGVLDQNWWLANDDSKSNSEEMLYNYMYIYECAITVIKQSTNGLYFGCTGEGRRLLSDSLSTKLTNELHV